MLRSSCVRIHFESDPIFGEKRASFRRNSAQMATTSSRKNSQEYVVPASTSQVGVLCDLAVNRGGRRVIWRPGGAVLSPGRPRLWPPAGRGGEVPARLGNPSPPPNLPLCPSPPPLHYHPTNPLSERSPVLVNPTPNPKRIWCNLSISPDIAPFFKEFNHCPRQTPSMAFDMVACCGFDHHDGG